MLFSDVILSTAEFMQCMMSKASPAESWLPVCRRRQESSLVAIQKRTLALQGWAGQDGEILLAVVVLASWCLRQSLIVLL